VKKPHAPVMADVQQRAADEEAARPVAEYRVHTSLQPSGPTVDAPTDDIHAHARAGHRAHIRKRSSEEHPRTEACKRLDRAVRDHRAAQRSTSSGSRRRARRQRTAGSHNRQTDPRALKTPPHILKNSRRIDVVTALGSREVWPRR
jgi:hypothetical protein